MGGGGGELEMSWQPSLLSQKRKSGPPLGLRNLGNSCYLNSVLQCLTYTPPLANLCLRFQHSSLCDSNLNNGDKKRDCPFCILEKRIVCSLRSDGTLDTPQKILSCLRIFAEQFRCGRQEDAHEFLRYVIDACHNTCLRLKKLRRSGDNVGSGDTVVKEIFGGALQSQVKCSSCNLESNKLDEIMDISLDVLTSNSLKDAMQKFFQPEILDGSNKYKCENCKKLVTARKQMSIRQAPNILVIQLKRFEGIFGGKIEKAIAFEEVLALSSFMSKGSQDSHPQYKLFGIIVHSGVSAESGHYYAYIKDAVGRWYCCNDSFVSVSSLQEVLSEKAYILFFSRTNKKGVPAGTSCASNGAKSSNSRNLEPSKIPKPSHPINGVPMKHSLQKEMPLSNGEKAPSSPQLKFHVNGNSGSKKAPVTVNGKVDVHRTNGVKGDAKQSDQMEKLVKDSSPAKNMNGFHKQKDVISSDGKTDTSFKSVRENGASHPVTHNLHDNNGTLSRKVGIGSNKNESQNGVDSSNFSGSKRKAREDTCVLLAQDDHSQAKIEELKQSLETETLSVLRSSDWYETVLSFMRSEKQQRTEGAESTQSNDILKRKLVEAAKTTFVPRIPVSVKQILVKRLQAFIKEK